MDSRPDAVLLWARALGVGSMAVFLGVAGHATADGLLPGPGVLTALTVAAVLLCVPLLARPASALRLVAVMVGGQAVVHVVLTLTAGHVGDPVRTAVTATPGGASLPEVGGRRLGSLADAYDAAAAVPASGPALPAHLVADLTAHAPMMAVHLAAAALVGLWIAVGERALWHVLALTGRRLLLAVDLLLTIVVHGPVLRPVAADRPVRPVATLWRSRPQLRRGPPLLVLAA